jgi:hypothetical protein
MDTFQRCREASEKASWSFEKSLGGLSFDFTGRFLPLRLCGEGHPAWMSADQQRTLNHIRGFSYAHIFLFVEEFIIHQTCTSAAGYVHQDMNAVSALLKFADEETKHQRMFELVKDLVAEGLGARPGELGDKEGVARHICSHSELAVYLVTIVLEWLTQRHYVECFKQEEAGLDPGFVRVFRLHWTEEAQHARLDAIQLQAIAADMHPDAITQSVQEFAGILKSMAELLRQQDALDLASLEAACGGLTGSQRAELLECLHRDWLWTFILSGLEHESFQRVYKQVVPEGNLLISEVEAMLQAPASPPLSPADDPQTSGGPGLI